MGNEEIETINRLNNIIETTGGDAAKEAIRSLGNLGIGGHMSEEAKDIAARILIHVIDSPRHSTEETKLAIEALGGTGSKIAVEELGHIIDSPHHSTEETKLAIKSLGNVGRT